MPMNPKKLDGPLADRFLIQAVDYLASRYLAFRAARHLESRLPPVAVFAFDHIGHEINLKGRFEGTDLDVIFQFLYDRGLLVGSAVDVGANIGNHSLFFSDYFESVVCLEPNPRVFELLCFNTRPRANIKALNVGASDTNGQMSLSFDTANWGGGHLTRSREGDSLLVEVSALDDLPELASRRIGLIKIDVEGHELRVIKGAEKLLTTARPVVLFEQHPSDVSDGGSGVIGWLRAHGYGDFYEVRSFPAVPKGWTLPGRTVLNGLMRIVAGERKRVVPITRFSKGFYPLIIALPTA